MEKIFMRMRTIKISKDLQIPPERIKLLRHYIAYVFRALSLNNGYKIYIVNDREKWGIETTAVFKREERFVIVYGKGRSFIDILRSLAHEFVHAKQFEAGVKFDHSYLHFNNEAEDEANAVAGEILNAYTEVMGHHLYENP